MDNGKHLFRAVAEEVWHRGNLAYLRHAYSPGFLGNSPRQRHQSLAAYRAGVAAARTGFPDVRIHVLGQLAEGNCVATRYRVQGTHLGEFMGIPPTGKPIALEGITIDQLTHGRIAESWSSWDVPVLAAELVGEREGG